MEAQRTHLKSKIHEDMKGHYSYSKTNLITQGKVFWRLLVLMLLNVCCICFKIIMWTILLVNIFMLSYVSLGLLLFIPSRGSLLFPTHEGILLHIAMSVSQCQLTFLFKVCIYNLLCYTLKPGWPFGLWWSGWYFGWDFY